MILIENLTHEVDLANNQKLRVLHDINLSLSQVKSLAIVGQSGSGKSTLLSLMAGLEKPTRGKISLLNQSIDSMDEEQCASFRAQNLGFVFQNFQLLNHFSALTNVALAAQLHGNPHAMAAAKEHLAAVGLGNRLTHTPQKLSGGECQRVAIARALVNQPKLIFCDEPTGSLDPETAEVVFTLLMKAAQERGAVVVLVTHDLLLASRCEKQIRLSKGSLVEELKSTSSWTPPTQSEIPT